MSHPRNAFHTEEWLNGSKDMNSHFKRVSAFISLTHRPKFPLYLVETTSCLHRWAVLPVSHVLLSCHAGWCASGWTSLFPRVLFSLYACTYPVCYTTFRFQRCISCAAMWVGFRVRFLQFVNFLGGGCFVLTYSPWRWRLQSVQKSW